MAGEGWCTGRQGRAGGQDGRAELVVREGLVDRRAGGVSDMDRGTAGGVDRVDKRQDKR